MRTQTASLLSLVSFVLATPVIYDGRTPLNYTEADLNVPDAPYTYVVRGSQNASYYCEFERLIPPTPLWYGVAPGFLPLPEATEQTVHVKIDNTSVFVPGGNPANAQYGFRRTEIIAQNSNRTLEEIGTTVFHFSIAKDDLLPLNPKHQYQIVFIEPNDGTHVFQVLYGADFTNPTAAGLPSYAKNLQITDHALNIIYQVPFESLTWYNFAVQVDWTNRTLGIFASKDLDPLEKVTPKVLPNLSSTAGPNGQGDFHFGVLKLPLANPNDTPANQGDVVHHGIQEGTTEALYYSGVFVEQVTHGVSIGYGKTVPAITA